MTRLPDDEEDDVIWVPPCLKAYAILDRRLEE